MIISYLSIITYTFLSFNPITPSFPIIFLLTCILSSLFFILFISKMVMHSNYFAFFHDILCLLLLLHKDYVRLHVLYSIISNHISFYITFLHIFLIMIFFITVFYFYYITAFYFFPFFNPIIYNYKCSFLFLTKA